MGTAAFRDHPAARHLVGKHVLIAEDDADIRKMLRIVLEQVGAVVSEAGSAKQTFARLQDGGLDAVVLDWNLAGATGDLIFAEIATLSPPFTAPILVISGDPRVTATAVRGAPRIAVLLKPFLPVDLVADLGALLSAAD
jgi:DNA-binding response OmpR family regulator